MSEPQAGQVLALHGWGLGPFAVGLWCHRLHEAGFEASAFPYRSRTCTLDENGQALAQRVSTMARSGGPVHLVGHSLGGLVILHALSRHRLTGVGRVVLAGTPFQGSEVARHLDACAGGRRLLGRSVTQWRPFDTLAMAADVQIGTLAGSRPFGIGRWLSTLPLPNDGTVAVAETHVPFATDHLVMPVTHSEMLIARSVTSQITQFLRGGAFLRQ
jgi:pimeloyl-ACP methyl ester carboxylesterase